MGRELENVGHERRQLDLSDRALRYARKSLSENTVRTYQSAWREFEAFASGRGEAHLPAAPSTVVEYIAELADAGAKASTIGVKLAAIAWAHRNARVADPTVYPDVKLVMAGIRRELGTKPDKKEAIALDELEAMIVTVDTSTMQGKRDRALLLVGWAGAFRRSELVALNVADLTLNGDLRIRVTRSKTDQEGEGQVKAIPAIGGELCPVAALRDWLDAAGIYSGPVFRSVDRWDNVRDDRLSPQSVALIVKRAAGAAGLDARSYSAHSLRRGFVTAALDGEASDSDVMQQTGHATEAMMREYRQDNGLGAIRAVRAAFGTDDDTE